jgi:hypothetical protein
MRGKTLVLNLGWQSSARRHQSHAIRRGSECLGDSLCQGGHSLPRLIT